MSNTVVFTMKLDRRYRRPWRGVESTTLTVQVRDGVLTVRDDSRSDQLPVALLWQIWHVGGIVYQLQRSQCWGAYTENRWSQMMAELEVSAKEQTRLLASTQQDMQRVISRHVSLSSKTGVPNVRVQQGAQLGLRVDHRLGSTFDPPTTHHYVAVVGRVTKIDHVDFPDTRFGHSL